VNISVDLARFFSSVFATGGVMLESLRKETKNVGKNQWQAMLAYLVDLHERSLHPPTMQFPYSWESISADEQLQMVFGHWDTVHIALDTLEHEPTHAVNQLENLIALQQENGLIPGPVWIHDNTLSKSSGITFPPLWPVVVEDAYQRLHNPELLQKFIGPLLRQIGWFEGNRASPQGGFYYLDCLDSFWESGVQQGIRFDGGPSCGETHEETGCVDASAHVWLLYDHAERWQAVLKGGKNDWHKRREELRAFIQGELFSEETGFFHDHWSVSSVKRRVRTFEGIWPVVVGVATAEQAKRVVWENLLDPRQFFTPHPIPSVALSEPGYSSVLWRGPTRNSMTYWAARGCLRYGWNQAAKSLLENALDGTAKIFQQTGKLWEFYPPQNESVSLLSRDVQGIEGVLPDYLGHNPLIAMAVLWQKTN